MGDSKTVALSPTLPGYWGESSRPFVSLAFVAPMLVAYEMGLQQQLTESIAFDISGFYKDVRDYLATQTIRFSTVAGQDVYSIQLNRNYANVKGVTFALTKRRGRNGMLGATLDYTFLVAEGNRTDSDAFFFNSLSGRETETG